MPPKRSAIRRTGRLARYNTARLYLRRKARLMKKRRSLKTKRKWVPRSTLVGFKYKLKRSNELKYGDVEYAPEVLPEVPSIEDNPGWLCIWRLNGTKPDNTGTWQPTWTQGVTQQNIIGNQINHLYVDLRFILNFKNVVNGSGSYVNFPSDMLRMVMIKQRDRQVDFSTQSEQADKLPTNMTESIQPNFFKTIIDKCIPFNTGASVVGDVSNARVNSFLSHPSIRLFRFLIPLKRTIDIVNATTYTWPLNIGIFVTTMNGSSVTLERITCRYYWKDNS